MPGFSDLAHHSAAATAVVGVLSFLGQLGCGLGLLRPLRLRVSSPWREVLAALVGLLSFGLLVQVVAMSAVATRPVLIGLWVLSLVVGLPLAVARLRESGFRAPSNLGASGIALLGLGAIAALTNLLLAAGPSTKADEVYYHMLLPARIVLTGSLEFFLQPWPAAILPQMAFQIAAAPLHALGIPDAANVVSWCQSLLLSWLAYRLVQSATGDRGWSLLAGVAAQIGLHPSVLYTTGGAHALGDLASAAALLALLAGRSSIDEAGGPASAGVVAICAVAAASAKISLLPFAVLATLLSVFPPASGPPVDRRPGRRIATALLPWLVFFLPIALWTWATSGSPFGPLLAHWLGPSVYGESISMELAGSRAANLHGLPQVVTRYLISTAPPIWVGAVALFFMPALGRRRRTLAAGLLALQLLLVWRLLPQDLRFLAGLPFALSVAALIGAFPLLRAAGRLRLALSGLALLLLPWLGAQLYRARDLVPVAVGLEDPRPFARRHVAFYEDLEALHEILPDEAVLYARYRTPSVYSPRPIYYDRADLPHEGRVFGLDVREEPLAAGEPLTEATCERLALGNGCDLGPVVYQNLQARYRTFRTPGRAALLGAIQVREIRDPNGPADSS